jgi:hypothetical protein
MFWYLKRLENSLRLLMEIIKVNSGAKHCSPQPFLSATKPNLHVQDISDGLGGFFLRRCGDMGIGI